MKHWFWVTATANPYTTVKISRQASIGRRRPRRSPSLSPRRPEKIHFSGAQRIFLFLDRKTKDPTGDATVTFQSPESAKKAIDQFDQTDFNGHGMITVKQASPDQKNPFAEMLVSGRYFENLGFFK